MHQIAFSLLVDLVFYSIGPEHLIGILEVVQLLAENRENTTGTFAVAALIVGTDFVERMTLESDLRQNVAVAKIELVVRTVVG